MTLAVAGAVSGCGAASLATASQPPPVLRLLDNGPTAAGGAALGAPAVAGGGAGAIELRTTLPTARPAPAHVYRLPAATSADAAAVAGALAVSGDLVAVAGGWAARAGGNLLAVRADGSWSYGLDCAPAQPVSAENLQVMCATATAGGTGVPPPAAGPSWARTRALATPILRRLHADPAAVSVFVGAPTSTLTADATVDGLTAADRLTTLSFAPTGALVSGAGWVGVPHRAAAYPMIDATRAFAMLRDQPRPMPMICRPLPHHRPGCAPLPPTVVTGATLGLARRHEARGPVLVPAWLFTVQGSPWPLSVVAVDPRYLVETSGAAGAGSSTRG